MDKRTRNILKRMSDLITELSEINPNDIPFVLSFIPQEKGGRISYTSLVMGENKNQAINMICTMMICDANFRKYVQTAALLYEAIADSEIQQRIKDAVEADTFAFQVLNTTRENDGNHEKQE